VRHLPRPCSHPISLDMEYARWANPVTLSKILLLLDLKNSDYYFVGRQREAPQQYFWRKLKVREGAMIRNESTRDGRWEVSAAHKYDEMAALDRGPMSTATMRRALYNLMSGSTTTMA